MTYLRPGDAERWSRTTRSARGTEALAAALGRALPLGSVVALEGELGAGKTCFARGFAVGFGVDDPREVLSPTYTLANEYPAGTRWLVHMDLYRLDGADAARALGLAEHFDRADAVVLVEWPERAPGLLPSGAVTVKLERVGPASRRITVIGAPALAAPLARARVRTPKRSP